MYSNRTVVIGLFSFLILFSFIPTSQAELWEFIVELDMEKREIHYGDTVVVTGRVINHAYEPTRGVEVLIRTGSETTKAFTDPNGVFRGEFTEFQRIPGTYTVNVIASWYGMTGLSSTQFEMKGNGTPISGLQEKLSTEEARKYLSANESDFEKNPIGQTLFKYYHELHEELIKEKKKSTKSAEDRILVEQQRTIAENLRNQAIAKYSTNTGVYDGLQYENYINSLNPKIKDLVESQLNYTKNNFENAQNLRNEIINNGGTYEEARQIFLDTISISKETLEQFNQLQANESSEKQLGKNQTSHDTLEEQE